MTDYARMFRERFSTALVADSAFRAGVPVQAASPGLTVIDQASLPVGPVVTVQANNDLVAVLEAVHRAAHGDVVVISNDRSDVGVMGDLIGAEALRKGLGGFVVNGSIRDRAELVSLGVPVACRGAYPIGPLKLTPAERGMGVVNELVDVGGATVSSGMWAFADSDGAVFVDDEDVAAVVARAEESVRREEALAAEIEAGTSLGDAFALDAFLATRASDPTASFGDHLARIGKAI